MTPSTYMEYILSKVKEDTILKKENGTENMKFVKFLLEKILMRLQNKLFKKIILNKHQLITY